MAEKEFALDEKIWLQWLPVKDTKQKLADFDRELKEELENYNVGGLKEVINKLKLKHFGAKLI